MEDDIYVKDYRLQFFVPKYARDTIEECDWQFPTVSVKQWFGAGAIKSSGD